MIKYNSSFKVQKNLDEKNYIIPPKRVRYLSEIAEKNREYNKLVDQQKDIAQNLYALNLSKKLLKNSSNNTIDNIQKNIMNLKLNYYQKVNY